MEKATILNGRETSAFYDLAASGSDFYFYQDLDPGKYDEPEKPVNFAMVASRMPFFSTGPGIMR